MPSIDKKKKTQQNKILYIFLTAFFVSLVTIIYLATAFTPEIDVDVNTDTPQSTYAEKQDIDSRLKDLQEDEFSEESENELATEETEITSNLKRMKEEALARQMKKDEIELETEPEIEQAAPVTPKLSLAHPTYSKQAPTPIKMAKVYVGRYATFDEAIKIQDILVQSSLASSPFIKNIGGYYVIQIGSYANHQTAQNIAENIIEHGFSARMVVE